MIVVTSYTELPCQIVQTQTTTAYCRITTNTEPPCLRYLFRIVQIQTTVACCRITGHKPRQFKLSFPSLTQDYFVFLPEEYYTGRILRTERVDPCVVDGPRDEICDLYSYPEVSDEHAVKHEAEHGYFAREAWGTEDKLVLKYYSNNTVLQQLTGNQLVLMNNEQVIY